MPRLILPAAVILALLPLAACQSAAHKAQATIANPASVNCTQTGGQLVIRQSAAGSKGYCILPDGRSLDEWEYYHQTHP